MPASASKPDRSPDVAQNALRVAMGGTGQAAKAPPPAPTEPGSAASATARTLGAVGACKGGVAQAKALSKEQRAGIARRATAAGRGGKAKKGAAT